MKALVPVAILVAAACCTFSACKTTEANYRAAYEKTLAGRQDADPLDSTIYGDIRRQMNTRTVALPDGRDVELRSQFVRVTDNAGGIPENLRRYNVVVGQFKQLFNARSLRNRIADNGYPGAFVVETAEPFYYVVASSYSDLPDATAALDRIINDGPVKMKKPLPFILDATARRK